MLTIQTDFGKIFDDNTKPLLIAHHVQAEFYTPCGATPNNQETANKIVSLAKDFIDAKLRVFVTELNADDNLEPWGITRYGGVHPELTAIGLSASTHYTANVADYTIPGLRNHNVIVLTGFNTSLCILESVKAIRARFPDVTIVVPKDAVANSFNGKAQNNDLSHEEALAKMEELGCIITDTESVKAAVKRLVKAPAPV